ncbi:Uu.00g013330.m01.CDS01 [Anthostomella pinea]|uniref:Uu.00g013330.m01.CDS01 n=1 Tax=Anthostomella pinea TaxID=933095 RepID=A0AAI8VYS9_9PEZI|nr:Uu.00g013330.m01.CDS01 [Anthostomella pinea]
MRGRGAARGGRGGRTPSAPWSRLKPVELDPLESMGLPSKGDNRLLDSKTQERYYTKIVERYMTFCSDAGERDELLRRFASLDLSSKKETASSKPTGNTSRDASQHAPPRPSMAAPATVPNNTKGLSDVLSALRKLREGIVASKRMDDFAIQTYLFCIRLSVLVKHPESYHPAILHLLRRIQPFHSMTTVEMSEVVGYLVLDTACRRNDLGEAFALRHRYRLKDTKVDGVLDALAHDNYVEFNRLKRRVDGHRAKLLEYAEEGMRKHVLKCFGRTYLSVDLEFLETCTGSPWARLTTENGVGWELEGGKVIIRRVKAR